MSVAEGGMRMAWITPITDRTSKQATRADNHDDYDYFVAQNNIALAAADGSILAVYYFDVAKGQYNYTDLNRVEGNAEEIASLLNNYAYPVTITVKTNWTRTDIPKHADTVRYLDNMQALINAFYTKSTTPSVPADMMDFNYTEANAIEQIEADIYELIKNMTRRFKPAGTFAAGQANILPRSVI
jgi:hypothetical protein